MGGTTTNTAPANTKMPDYGALTDMYSTDGTLRDWDIEKSGNVEVGKANGGIFEAVPAIKIEVLAKHVAGTTVAAEILVHLNNDSKEVLKVVDVIDFDESGKIKALRAYKG